MEKVLFEIQRRSPVLTDAEKQMGQQLRQLQSKLDTLKRSMESLRRKEQLCAKVSSISDVQSLPQSNKSFSFLSNSNTIG